jgi:hypothetical protein
MSATIADVAPDQFAVTPYDEAHLHVYRRLLDAKAEGMPWTEVAHFVLGRDVTANPEGARRCWLTHLERAEWMTREGWTAIMMPSQPKDVQHDDC